MALTNIIADFSKATVCETVPAYQYDHGRRLVIKGTDITAPIEVHFSTTDKGGEAITRTATYENGVLSVAVPNTVLRGVSGLRRDYNMHAYIYYDDGDTGATIYHATVPIKTRPIPADDIPDDDEKTALQEAIEALQHMPQIHAEETETGYSVTITQADGTTETVYLVDGEKGDKGDKGDTGADGYSPTITTAEVTGGTQVIIMDKNGAHTFIVADGRKGDKGDTGAKGDKGEKGDTGAKGDKGEKGDTGAKGDKGDKGDTGAQGLKGDKGDKGDTGAQGQQGQKGDTGADGFSPTVSTADITGTRTGTRITITDATGAHTFDVMNGIDGETPTVDIITTLDALINTLPTDTASGAVASFSDGADDIPVKNLTIDIVPIQDLHGYDRPWGAGKGKNLLDPSLLKNQSGWNIIKIYANEGTVLTASTSTPSGRGLIAYFRQPNGEQGTANGVVTGAQHKAVTQTVGSDGYVELVQRRSDGTDSFQNYNWQVEVGSVQTDYEPYENVCPISGWTGATLTCNNETINIDWTDEAGTVYGGTLDVTTGELIVDRIGFDGGDINWIKVDDYNYGNFCSTNLNPLPKYSATVPTVFSSIYRSAATSSGTSGDVYAWIRSVNTGMRRIYIKDTSKANMTAEEIKTSLIGVDFVYVLDTPIVYQLTPQEVKTILGENNIFADTGDVSVEYRADIKKYIDKVVATAVSALS